jgi:hypothetical protein
MMMMVVLRSFWSVVRSLVPALAPRAATWIHSIAPTSGDEHTGGY